MAAHRPRRTMRANRHQLEEAMAVLAALRFDARQANEIAAYTLLALLDLRPEHPWSSATAPLRGITPIIQFVATAYRHKYAPNTRETIRDDAVKYFVEHGLVLRNPDDPLRPTNSGKTVYQIEPRALELLKCWGAHEWPGLLAAYLASREHIQREIERARKLTMVPVILPDGSRVALSPGGQNPLIKAIVEKFCPRFLPGCVLLYLGDTKGKFPHLEVKALANLGIKLAAAAKVPDVIVHCRRRKWLVLIEAVTSAGPIDGKRRKELKELFASHAVGLVFVTAFENRRAMQSFLQQIAWETEVWVADNPDHMIHFNGERFLGPYPDKLT